MSNPLDNQTDAMKSVMRRLKKIMALSSSSNPGESAAALHQAETLMRKHGLTQQDVAMSSIAELEFELGTAQVAKNDVLLVALVKKALGVEAMVFSYKKTKGIKRPPAKIVFIGEYCRVEIAKYSFVQLRRHLSKSMKGSFEQMLQDSGHEKTALRLDAKRRDAYAQSWVYAVYEKVQALAPEASPHLTEYMAKQGVKEATVIQRTEVTSKDDPITQFMALMGHKDGRATQLHQGVNSEANKPLAITA